MAIFRPYLCWELFVVLSLADYSLVPQMWSEGGGRHMQIREGHPRPAGHERAAPVSGGTERPPWQ